MVPEVASRGVGVPELLEILADTLLELVWTDVSLNHSKNTCALAVANLVEQFFDLFRRSDFGLDGMSAVQCVSGHRSPGAGFDKVLPDPPLWISPVNYLIGHEGREALIKPEVIPPLHSDEIAEPHVRNFVRDYFGNAFFR